MDQAMTANGSENEEAVGNYFDEEATLLARPVVPIERGRGKRYWRNSMRGAMDAGRSSYSPGFLAVVVVSAALAGAAGALAINVYTNRGRSDVVTPNMPQSLVDSASEGRQPSTQTNEAARIRQPISRNAEEASTQVSGVDSRIPSEANVPPGPPSKPSDLANKQAQVVNSTDSKVTHESGEASAKKSSAPEPTASKHDRSQSATKTDGKGTAKPSPKRSPSDADIANVTHQPPAKPAQQDLSRIRDIFEGRQP